MIALERVRLLDKVFLCPISWSSNMGWGKIKTIGDCYMAASYLFRHGPAVPTR